MILKYIFEQKPFRDRTIMMFEFKEPNIVRRVTYRTKKFIFSITTKIFDG